MAQLAREERERARPVVENGSEIGRRGVAILAAWQVARRVPGPDVVFGSAAAAYAVTARPDASSDTTSARLS